MTRTPSYRVVPLESEPPRWHQWAWLSAALVLIPLVYFLQQFTLNLRGQTLSSVPRQVAEREIPDDPGIARLTLQSKAMVRLARFADHDDPERAKPEDLDEIALTRVDRVRVAIVAGELEGPEEAVRRLDALSKEAEPNGDLATELVWLRRLYTDGAAAVPDEARESLISRHGWFGRLALSGRGQNGGHSRGQIVGGGARIATVFLAVAVGQVAALVIGLIMLLVMVGLWRHGALESQFEGASGGTIYVETFVIFAGGFLFLLGMTLVMFGFNAESTTGALAFLEVLTWLLVACLAWPVIRRVPWRKFAWDLGLHTGEGFGKEVLCGVAGWLASVPITIGIVLLIKLITSMAGLDEEAGSKGYPLFEPPAGNSWGLLWLDMLSAVVWAPFLEETVFRGALFTFLRPKLKFWGTALATSAIFGLVHPYTTAGLVQVATLGLVLAALREWRGSLIAPMVCHFLHNATISLITVLWIAVID
jgi:membrane protease YdiL (CAAX protease family)